MVSKIQTRNARMFRAGFLLCIVAFGVRSVTGQGSASSTTSASPTTSASSTTSASPTRSASSTTSASPTRSASPTTSASPTRTTPIPTLDSTLQYSCDQSQTEILIPININQLASYEVVAYTFRTSTTSPDKSIAVPCDVVKNMTADGIKIKNCWNTKVNIVPTQVIAPVSQGEHLIGGKYSVMYTVQCIGPAREGDVVSMEIGKAVEFAGSLNSHDEGEQNGYTFTIDITDSSHHLDKDKFLIGDLLHLKISLSGTNDNVSWSVQFCIAVSGNMVLKFFNTTGITDKQIAQATDKTNTTVLGTSQTFEVDLYAFHALNSNKVVYSCELQVCKGSGCKLKRRRRSLTNLPLQKKHTKVIYVYDSVEDITDVSSHSGHQASPYVRTILAVAAIVLMLI